MAVGAPATAAIALETIWDVDETSSYDVRRIPPERDRLIALKTHAGTGELAFVDGRVMSVGRDTLVLFDLARVARYRCAADRWTFWWFEFRSSGAPACEFETVMSTRAHPDDPRAFRETFAALRRDDPLERAVASSGFSLLLYRWLSRRRDRASDVPHGEAVRRVVDLMHERSAGAWPVAEMAREAQMSERLFRQAFHRATGVSPKRFFEHIRLERGRALLQLGIYPVKAVAEQLGFSSPFHFSREFKKQFGSPPASSRGGGGRVAARGAR
jgi:AraC-like DNA-binding protein